MLHIAKRVRFSVSRYELALIAITALWGTTFLIVHLAMAHTGPWFFVGLRFAVAGLVSVAVFHRSLMRIRWRELGAGAAIGAAIALGYGLQTAGLATIPSSTSAFITAFYVPLVPLLQWLVLRRPPRRMTLVGVGFAFAGLLFIAGPAAFTVGLGPGEIATLVSTVPIAAEIILISAFASRVDARGVTIVQLLAAGAFGFVAMPLTGEAAPAPSWDWLVPAIGLGIASCLIQLTMNWAQRHVSPTRATIIYAGEPVWGGIVGRLAGDRMPLTTVVGALLVVVGVLVSELRGRGARPAEEKRVLVGTE
ncbi:DMT family transporter [Leifsonia shinshuensis]|uniref:Drug/metabolite transporter (DMT)-like permease n=1 Tax=Leifsonia shinshuensis TaxID=150026 RepID=A0A853D047_9MICO|nr:DMT family transporter [Leifsonia shinshuensis]NYJ25493.1 drug/metabolite transporter (DMT)-like permease [Leifsonia shinshuensis]